MKRCSICRSEKDDDSFYRRGNGTLSSACKPCDRIRANEWRKNHPDRARENVRRFRERNPGVDGAQIRAYDRALAELRDRHRAEFDQLYSEYKQQVSA